MLKRKVVETKRQFKRREGTEKENKARYSGEKDTPSRLSPDEKVETCTGPTQVVRASRNQKFTSEEELETTLKRGEWRHNARP